jgi:MFS family permease
MAGTLLGSMDSYIVNTSMPRVLAELGEPQFYAWVTSAFTLAQVVGLSIGGAWKDRSGLRTPFIVAVVGFGIGSLLCGLAPSMSTLVFARAFQGLSGGALSALGFAAAASYPEGVRLRMLSIISGVWGIIALGAPLLGGFITETLGWRWIFYVNLPLCVIAVGLAAYALANSQKPDKAPTGGLPIWRALLLAIAVAGLTAAPSATRELAIGLLVIGVVAAILYARAERRAASPIIPRETWLRRGAVGSSLHAIPFYTGSYTGAGLFLPLYLVELRHESTTEAGIALGIGGFMWTVGSIWAAGRGGHWPKLLARIGALLIVAAGVSIAAQAVLGSLPLFLVYVTWAAAGFGVGLAMLHLTNWAIVYAPPTQSGAVSGAALIMRMIGGAAAGALMGAVLNAIGPDEEHLPYAIAAIFLLCALIAAWPATFGAPKVSARAAE